MSSVHKYQLINYFDVWGNAEDGWEVNNQCVECDDLCITEDSTPKEICEYLKRNGYLATSDMRKIEVENMGEMIEIYEKKSMKPLYGLREVV